MSDLKTTVFDAVAQIMEIDVATVNEDTSAATVASWDSLRQLNLVMALEEALDLEFPEEELPHLSSVKRILSVLEAQ